MYVLNSVNPFRIEGQKTAAYEVCDQLGGVSPEYLYIPVGNGGNSAAYWKGFTEYEELGFASGRPMIRGIQADGAAPVADMLGQGPGRARPGRQAGHRGDGHQDREPRELAEDGQSPEGLRRGRIDRDRR